MLAENLPSDDLYASGFRYVGHAAREHGIAVVGLSVFGKKADKALNGEGAD